ncbi:Penicillin acylase precursor [Roseovarius albus]|uniref:Penicillin acylase n=1 Tax=Roseovarius albus TaxID=1247867 RepID=A0A1X6ZIC9_9RHOB|nr:linear amide C-N hydrolase [Roseovarius albus]SLN52613.1 Penicillin acylase precursor [Roseovarius albus]
MKTKIEPFVLLVGVCTALSIVSSAQACTRFVYKSGSDTYFTGRSLDWFEDVDSDFWVFPRGMERDGGLGDGSIEWVSQYGSVILSGYDIGSVDGMNEVGLVANLLYLSESDYGEAEGKAILSVGAWAQFALDNYATVAEAVEGLSSEPFALIAPPLPDGNAAGLHLSLSDATGDSAIFEYLDGELVVHHGPEFTVMTNSPPFDEQLALTAYWEQVGGLSMLPGTNRAADRFIRASFYLGAVPEFEDVRMATSAAFSIIRNASVPLGIADPDAPNIATTVWRTVMDHENKLYYFESAISPNVYWVDLNALDFSAIDAPLKLELRDHPILTGDVSDQFVPAEPFKWLAP